MITSFCIQEYYGSLKSLVHFVWFNFEYATLKSAMKSFNWAIIITGGWKGGQYPGQSIGKVPCPTAQADFFF